MNKVLKKKIVFFHMLNDFSGSPHVLSLIIKGLVSKGFLVEIYTSSSNAGFLSGLDGVKYNDVFYRFTKNKLLTLFLFITAQFKYFFAVLKYKNDKEIVIYVNTILPFGAALGAYTINKKTIYHVHEKPVTRNLVHSFAILILQRFANKAVFVSQYLFNSFEKIPVSKKKIVYNALSPEFTLQASNVKKTICKFIFQNVLMICSLRVFKGVFIFVDLAIKLPLYSFTLVLNAKDTEIATFFEEYFLPQNINIVSTQTNVAPFYEKASVVLNLSIPDLCVETFGLTILEAMSYGIPVIVPPVGGVAELVENDHQGFKVDSTDMGQLTEKINYIFKDEVNYKRMSEEAYQKSKLFSCDKMINEIEDVINSLEVKY